MERADVIGAYKVAELTTLTRDGSPVCWPMMPALERGRVVFSTGFMYPTKARNAKRDARVAVLFSDPSGSGRSDDDPLVLVQGLAEVFDQDIQGNTERYVDQLMAKNILMRVLLRVPLLRRAMAGYLARIWIEIVPRRTLAWQRHDAPPSAIGVATRPATFAPAYAIAIPEKVRRWVPRYARPPVLAYVDADGWPAMTRARATLRPDHVEITSDLTTRDGAPACLTYHRLVGDYIRNDTFLIRGHFDHAGRLIPEKVVGFTGTAEDRGLGSLNSMRLVRDLTRRLPETLAREGRAPVSARPSR